MWKNGTPRLARDRTRQKRLATARRSQQQHTFGNLRAEFLVLLRVFEVVDDLGEFLLRLLYPCHIVEGHARDVLVVAAGARLAERERLIVACLRRTHQQKPEQSPNQQDDQKHPQHLAEVVGHAAVFGELEGDPCFLKFLIESIASGAIGRQRSVEVRSVP
jgi:hypothetical protein